MHSDSVLSLSAFGYECGGRKEGKEEESLQVQHAHLIHDPHSVEMQLLRPSIASRKEGGDFVRLHMRNRAKRGRRRPRDGSTLCMGANSARGPCRPHARQRVVHEGFIRRMTAYWRFGAESTRSSRSWCRQKASLPLSLLRAPPSPPRHDDPSRQRGHHSYQRAR